MEVKEAMGDHHITESNGNGEGSPGLPQLTVYVPKDRRSQSVCFVSALPQRLEDWLMRDATTQIRRYDKTNPEALAALIQILSADAATTDQVLDRVGAIPVPIPNQDEQIPEHEEDQEERCSAHSGRSAHIPHDFEISTEAHEDGFSQGVTAMAPRSGMAPSSSHAPPIYAAPQEDELYGKLLERVVRAARAAIFPSKGTFDMSALHDSLFSRDEVDAAANKFKSSTQLERDMKIGAAGELYVSVRSPFCRAWFVTSSFPDKARSFRSLNSSRALTPSSVAGTAITGRARSASTSPSTLTMQTWRSGGGGARQPTSLTTIKRGTLRPSWQTGAT